MPKILNLTNEEKADRYDKKFKKHHLTIEEKVGLWDAHRSRCLGYCRKYSTEHPDRIALTGAEYYEKNKI